MSPPAATRPSHLGWPAGSMRGFGPPTGAFEVCGAAIAEACVTSLGEVLGFRTIASVKRVSSGTFRFRLTEI
jgi:hypothetical protein